MSAAGAQDRGRDRGQEPVRRSTAALVVAWAIVGIPAAWGVLQTVTKALALFR